MQLTYSDRRPISQLTEFKTPGEIRTAPIEYSATVSDEAAALLKSGRAPFYRGVDGDQRFTLTIDQIVGTVISGTVRRR